MKLSKREITYTYTCGPYVGSTEPHWHGGRVIKIPHGSRYEGNGLHMTLPRALVYLVTGR